MRLIYFIGFWATIALGWSFFGYKMAILMFLVLVLSAINTEVVATDIREDLEDDYF